MNTTTATTEVTRPIATTRVAAQVQRCGGVTCPPGTCDHDDEIRRSADGPGPAAVPATVLGVLDTPGTPLDAGTRTSMEGRFGHDFGRVRIHTDADAARSAADIHALAYTYGPHVVMGAGRYQPHTSAGQRLLAHELTHVVQQGAPTGLPTSISNPHAAAERQADTVANEKTTAPAPSAASGLVARQVAGQVEATIARQAESVEAPAVATPSPPDAATDVEPTRATSPVRTPPQCPPYGPPNSPPRRPQVGGPSLPAQVMSRRSSTTSSTATRSCGPFTSRFSDR